MPIHDWGLTSLPLEVTSLSTVASLAARKNFTEVFNTADSKKENCSFRDRGSLQQFVYQVRVSSQQTLPRKDGARTVLAEVAGDLGLDVMEADDFARKPS